MKRKRIDQRLKLEVEGGVEVGGAGRMLSDQQSPGGGGRAGDLARFSPVPRFFSFPGGGALRRGLVEGQRRADEKSKRASGKGFFGVAAR